MGKRVNPPSFRKDRKREYRANTDLIPYNPYKMDYEVCKMIKAEIDAKGIKSEKRQEWFVNRLIPGRVTLYQAYKDFERNYERLNKKEKGQALLDKINEIADNMEEHKNFGLKVLKTKSKKKGEKEEVYNPYQRHFDFLDGEIDKIEVLIYLGVPPKRICIEYSEACTGLNPIIYERWAEWTKHLDRLKFAFKKSADEHMYASQEFLLEWLDKEKHPELDMQHVGIVREIALWRSRMAEFMDRKKYGKKVEIKTEQSQVKMLEGRNLTEYLKGLDSIAGRMKGGSVEPEDEESAAADEAEGEDGEAEGEESGYTDYEEL